MRPTLSLPGATTIVFMLAGLLAIPPATRLLDVESAASSAPADQAAPEVTFASPTQGEIVPDTFDARLQVIGTREDIHLLVGPTATPTTYTYVGRMTSPLSGQPLTMTRLVNAARFGTADTLRLVAIATNTLGVSAAGPIDERALPATAPTARVEIRRAGAILSPRDGTMMGAVDTVRVMGFVPNSYLSVIIRPVNDSAYWVQNNGLLVTPAVSMPARVHFGGGGVYHLYLGVTYDRELFKEGDRFVQLPTVDSSARPVYWLGPLELIRP